MIFLIPLLVAVLLAFALILGFFLIKKIIKQQASIAKERIKQEANTAKAKEPEQPPVTPQEPHQEVHYHVNSENFYAGDIGVVASDDAIVNRPNITTDAKKKCPTCGAELKNNDRFCSKCGTKLP